MSVEPRSVIILDLAEQTENFRFCSPSADPEEQDAVIFGFKHLAKRFLGKVRKIQNQYIQSSIKEINTDIENIYEAYDLHSDLQVLIDEIKEILSEPSVDWSTIQTEFIDSTIIEALRGTHSSKYDLTKVIEFCREINGTFNLGYFLATALLIRALINHVPPIFGHTTFAQVVSQSTKSRKELLRPLEDIARDVADLHTHDVIRHRESLPTRRQLEPFQPGVEILLQEIIIELQKVAFSEK